MRPTPFSVPLTGILLFIIFILQSCSTDKPGTWGNDEISSGKRDDFHTLNDQIFKGLTANDPKQMEAFMSQELMSNNYRYRQVELISNRIKEGPYTLLNEYYVVNEKRGKHIINVSNQGINNHVISYEALTPEMYLAFFVPKSGGNKWMISLVYCKFDYGWKLDALSLNPYTENGKTAPELFKQAKENYAKHYLFDASGGLEEAKDCLNPFEGWKYPILADMNDFNNKVQAETKSRFRFPLVLDQLPTRPRIFSVYNESKRGGVFPMVYYQTKFKLKDTAAIKQENKAMLKVIGRAIPGIDKNKKYILFAAFNEWPRSDRSVDRFEMSDELH